MRVSPLQTKEVIRLSTDQVPITKIVFSVKRNAELGGKGADCFPSQLTRHTPSCRRHGPRVWTCNRPIFAARKTPLEQMCASTSGRLGTIAAAGLIGFTKTDAWINNDFFDS